MSVFRELRNWIDGVAAKFDEGRKESKEKILAAKKKVCSFWKLLLIYVSFTSYLVSCSKMLSCAGEGFKTEGEK